VESGGFPDIGFNAKAQSRQDARQTLLFFAPWHLCVFALIIPTECWCWCIDLYGVFTPWFAAAIVAMLFP
jgi:hypothetical protein